MKFLFVDDKKSWVDVSCMCIVKLCQCATLKIPKRKKNKQNMLSHSNRDTVVKQRVEKSHLKDSHYLAEWQLS
jgi:hypothetical protein